MHSKLELDMLVRKGQGLVQVSYDRLSIDYVPDL